MREFGIDIIAAILRDHAALRRIARAGYLHFAARRHHALDGHLVARERAGLIRADHRSGAERFYGRELFDDGVMLGHTLHAEREHHGENRGQAFRHRRDGQRHGEQQRVDDVMDIVEALYRRERDEHDHGDDDHGDTQYLGDAVHLFLQRRRLVVGMRKHLGDLTDLRVHAGAGDDGAARALRDGGAVEDHIGAVAQRLGLLKCGGLLAHWHGFAGQAGLGDAQRCGCEQSPIGRHRVAFAQHENIAGNDLGRVDAADLAAAQHGGLRCGHLGQRVDGLLGLRLLQVAQHRVHDQNQHDNDGIEGQRLAALSARLRIRPLNEPRDQRNQRGGKQQVDQRILELLQELLPFRRFGAAGQLVAAELLQAPLRLVVAQAYGRVDVQRLGDILDVSKAGVGLVGRNLTTVRVCGRYRVCALRRVDWRHIH